MTVVDQELPDYVSDLILCLLEAISRIITIGIAAPIFLVVLLPIAAFYWTVTSFYRASSRELKRLDAISLSPLQQRFAETCDGLVSLRAFALRDRERSNTLRALDDNNTALFASRMSDRWLGVRIEGAGTLIVAIVSAVAVLGTLPSIAPYVGGVSSLLGLALTFAINLTSA